MALNANFNTSESLSANNLITFTDASTGSDNTLTARKIYVIDYQGKYLTAGGVQNTAPTAIDWNINDTSITVDLITQSTTARVRVDWMENSTIKYTKTLPAECWDLYEYLFALEILQSQTATPGIVQDTSYYSNYFMFLTNIFNAETAATYGEDVFSSQSALLRNQNLQNNSDKFF